MMSGRLLFSRRKLNTSRRGLNPERKNVARVGRPTPTAALTSKILVKSQSVFANLSSASLFAATASGTLLDPSSNGESRLEGEEAQVLE
jgi:hypothetical protein